MLGVPEGLLKVGLYSLGDSRWARTGHVGSRGGRVQNGGQELGVTTLYRRIWVKGNDLVYLVAIW